MRKKIIIMLLALLPAIAWAASEKAIYCAGNTTLYFVYDNVNYQVGDTYDGQEITAVYTDLENTGTAVPSWGATRAIRNNITTIEFKSTFINFRPKSLYRWFGELTSLKEIRGGRYLNTSDVTDMHYLFVNCKALTSPGLEYWNTSNVTDMSYMFEGCSALTSLDLSRWDTSKVTDMSYMFHDCSALIGLYLDGWNTSNVTDMNRMFWGCKSLSALGMNGWDTGSVTTMDLMFSNCKALTSLDLSAWDTGSVTTMRSMFTACEAMESLNLSGWDLSNVTDMYDMFYFCEKLTSLDVSGWDTSNVTYMQFMFCGCYSLPTVDVSGWNTSNVTTMYCMFQNCEALESIDVSGWDTRNVTDMYGMFLECKKLKSLTFGNYFSIDKVPTNRTTRMFDGCSSLRYLDFYASDDTDAVTDVYRVSLGNNYNRMFNGVPFTTVIFLPHGNRKELGDFYYYNAAYSNIVYSHNGDETDLRCAWYYSEDKVDIEFPRDFKTNKAEYSRPSMGSTYGTVVLPYDFTTNDDIQAYTLDEEHTETMYFKDAQTIPAHTPFAFKKLGTPQFIMEDESREFGITVKATHTTSAAEEGAPYEAATNLGGWTTKGYYVNETVSDYTDTYYVAGDKFYKADGALTMYPHRVTFHGTWTEGSPSEDAAGAKFYGIAVSDGQVTSAIEAADLRQAERDALDIYDAHGRRRDTLGRGLNIVRMTDGSVRKVMMK